jgi:guanylate kinase
MSSPQHKVIIIAAPSGAGKTSVTRHLLKVLSNEVAFSISAATRQPRLHEKDKTDYYFISVDAFKNKIDGHEFVEWEMVYEGKYYGTLKSELQRIWDQHKAPLLDVDAVYMYNSNFQRLRSLYSSNHRLLKNWNAG